MIKDFILNHSNLITIGATKAVGLIIMTLASLFGNPLPALRIENPTDHDRYFEISDHGSIGIGTGATAFGTSGQCLKSGGGSGNLMTFGTCGSGGSSGGMGTGGVIQIGDSHYVKRSGDTMTGSLNILNGKNLQVAGTITGSYIKAATTLTSSGGLVFEGAASGSSLYVATSIDGAGLVSCSNGSTSKLLWNSSTKRFSCGTDTDTNTTYTAGQNMNLLNSTVFQLNTTITGSTIKGFTTISGSLLRANTLASSGSLSVDGSMSGKSLAVSDLRSCDTIDTNAAGILTCGTDATGAGASAPEVGTSSFSGGVIRLVDGRYVNQAGDTMTGALTVNLSTGFLGVKILQTASGANIHAEGGLTSSGTLVVRGTMTGSGGTLTLARIGASTYKTIQDFMNFSESPGISSGGILVASGSYFRAGAGNGFIKATDSNIAQLNFMNWTGSAAIIGSNTTRYVGVDYNSGAPKVVLKTSDTFDLDTQFGLGVVVNDAGTLYKMGNGWQVGDTIANIIERLDSDAAISRDERQGGLTLANTGTRNITVSTGALLARLSEFNISGINTTLGGTQNTFDTYYRDGASGWTKATGATQWDNASYDDGDGTLGSVTALQYSSKWFYLMADGKLAMMYGRTVNTALGTIIQDDTPPSSVPDRIGKLGILIGRIIFQGSNSTPADTQSAFTTEFNPTIVVNHNDLANLTTGDPHTQYLYLAGRAGGQTAIGGTAVSDFLTLQSTAGNGSSDYIKFLVGNNGGTEAMRILTSGNVAIGATTADTKLEVIGTASGRVIYAQSTLASSGALIFEGAATGSSLYLGTSLKGAGLTADCDTAATSKVLWDITTGRFSCGTDTDTDTNTTYVAGQGLTLSSTTFKLNTTNTGSLSSYTTQSGSTINARLTLTSSGSLKVLGRMSGANLTINGIASISGSIISKGTIATHGTVSGSLIYATTTMASSGGLIWEGAASGSSLYVGTSLQGLGLTNCVGANALRWTSATGRFSCAADAGGTSYTAGQGLSLGTTAFSLNTTITGSLVSFQTVSGAAIYAKNTLTSSGTLKVLGNMSGASLNVNGAGTLGGNLTVGRDSNGHAAPRILNITEYSSAVGGLPTIIGNWNSTGLWGIGGNNVNSILRIGNVTGTSWNTAQNLQLNVNGFSGSLLHAEKTIASSGAVVWEGTASGSALFVARAFSGAGLTDCTGGNALRWASATGRFSCAADATAGSAGQGLTLTSGVMTLNTTNTGSMSNYLTQSGGTVYAHNKLNSSGSLKVLGNMSGSSLNVNINAAISGALAVKGNITTHATISGTTLTIMNGTNYILGNLSLGASGNAGSTKLDVAGTMSGRSLYVSGTGSNPMLMTQQTTGNVGVGTATPIEQFTVPGRVPYGRTGSGSTGLRPNNILVQNRYAFVTNSGSSTLQTFDVSNSISPSFLGSVATGKYPTAIALAGKTLFMTNSGSNTLQAFDISNPFAPTSISTVTTAAGPTGLSVVGRFAYVGDVSGKKVEVFDVSNPGRMFLMSSLTTTRHPRAIQVLGQYAYVAEATSTGASKLDVIDVSNPQQINLKGSLSPTGFPAYFGLQVQGRYAYITDRLTNAITVVDVSNPAIPSSASTFSTGTNPVGISIQGRYAYITNSGSTTMQILDVSTPTAVTSVGTVATGTKPNAITVVGRYAYVVNYADSSFNVFDVGGSYEQQLEAGNIEVGNITIRNYLMGMDAIFGGGITILKSLNVSGPSSITTTSTGGTALTISSNTGALRLVAPGTVGAPHIKFGTGNTFDTDLFRSGAGILRTSGQLQVVGAFSGASVLASTKLSSSGGFIVNGTPLLAHAVTLPLCDGSTACATGTGAAWRATYLENNFILSGAYIDATYSGVTLNMSVQIRNMTQAKDMLTTKLKLEQKKLTGTGGSNIVNGSNKTVVNGDVLVPVVTAVHTTPAKGVSVTLIFWPQNGNRTAP